MIERSRAVPVQLAPDEAHVWFVRTEHVQDAAWLAFCERLLSADEAARSRRFVSESDRREFLIAHAFVRTVLSKYADVLPSAWRFAPDPKGRPAIVNAGSPPLEFNLSHTKGLAACVVARVREVGVDVEDLGRRTAAESVAGAYFSPDEVAALEAQPPDRRGERFLELWTLKEAYVKARGLGLALPLQRFSFRLEDGRAPAISFAPELPDTAESWQFAQFRPTSSHVLAVAIRRGPEREMTIRLAEDAPLGAP